MTTALFFDELFLHHDTGPYHPENPERLRSIIRGLKENGLWDQLMHVPATPATAGQILLVHTGAHFDFIRDCSSRAPYQIDPDTHVSGRSFDAALLAAGASIRAVDGIMNGEFRNAFAAVRPPGHHATSNRAMGFCLFNNVAIAARYAVRHYGLDHVLIVDWDVHHGNGTQDIFYDDPAVIYLSLHRKYHYPGTGWEEETGSDAAEGTIWNVPVADPDPDMYEKKFLLTLEKVSDFAPEFIFISCGFDAHERDPLGNLGLTDETYARLTDALQLLAKQNGHSRILSVLEGGYDFEALANASAAHVRALMRYD